MKILTFLKGGPMKIQFNEAQLSRPQQQSLIDILDVLQSQNENELVVTAVEFPEKLMVKLDDDIELVLGWDVEKQCYAGLTTPEPEPESPNKPKTGSIKPFELPESQKDTVDLPEPELDLSPIVERVEALARAFAGLVKQLNLEQRKVIYIKFGSAYLEEIEK